MARPRSVAEFQSMQAEGDDQADDSTERLKALGYGANIHGIGPDTDGGPNPDYDPSADPLATIADHLLGLNVAASCTAQMSLHMISERVREAALRLPAEYAPTENDIVLEAERILGSFDVRAAGPREYDVAADGTVRDWRRPDTTPDRGDVTETHTITDETRFSGAGAGDGQQQSLFLVPSDSAFNGKLYRDAPELANIAETLIDRHGFLSGLVNAEIRYFWRRKTGVSKGRVKIGYCKRASDLLGHFTGSDFLIWLSATTARDGKFTDRQVEAALFHQLMHIGVDDEGNFVSERHDFEGFAQEIRHYGTWTEDLKLAVPAFKAAEQMGLFSDDDDGIEDDDDTDGSDLDCRNCGSTVSIERPLTVGLCEACLEEQAEERHRDDGSGYLIHADGTPLTESEIAAQHAAELADAPV